MTLGAAGPDIAVLGNLIVDDVVYEDGRTRMGVAGGAVVHFALGAALWGCSVAIVSVAGSDYPESILRRLEDRGINLDGVRRLDGPGMRTWLLYEGGGRRQVLHRLRSPNHHAMSPNIDDLPEQWSPKAVHLAPMPLDRQRSLLAGLRSTTSSLLSVDPYALIDESSWADCVEAFAGADILLASEDEILLDAEVDHRQRWFDSGIPLVLFKQGERGGTLFDGKRSVTRTWTGRADRVVDTTGAGDAFAGGLLAGLCQGDSIDEALKKAGVSASLTIECDGVEAMIEINPAEAFDRYHRWFT